MEEAKGPPGRHIDQDYPREWGRQVGLPGEETPTCSRGYLKRSLRKVSPYTICAEITAAGLLTELNCLTLDFSGLFHDVLGDTADWNRASLTFLNQSLLSLSAEMDFSSASAGLLLLSGLLLIFSGSLMFLTTEVICPLSLVSTG